MRVHIGSQTNRTSGEAPVLRGQIIGLQFLISIKNKLKMYILCKKRSGLARKNEIVVSIF